MYLHIGASVVIPEQDVLGIFDLDNTTSSRITRNFLAQAQQAGQVIPNGRIFPNPSSSAGTRGKVKSTSPSCPRQPCSSGWNWEV